MLKRTYPTTLHEIFYKFMLAFIPKIFLKEIQLQTKLSSSSLGINGLRVPPEIVCWNYDTFDTNFEIENDLTK